MTESEQITNYFTRQRGMEGPAATSTFEHLRFHDKANGRMKNSITISAENDRVRGLERDEKGYEEALAKAYTVLAVEAQCSNPDNADTVKRYKVYGAHLPTNVREEIFNMMHNGIIARQDTRWGTRDDT